MYIVSISVRIYYGLSRTTVLVIIYIYVYVSLMGRYMTVYTHQYLCDNLSKLGHGKSVFELFLIIIIISLDGNYFYHFWKFRFRVKFGKVKVFLEKLGVSFFILVR